MTGFARTCSSPECEEDLHRDCSGFFTMGAGEDTWRCGCACHLLKRERPTATERHQAAADAGIDTWEEYRGER